MKGMLMTTNRVGFKNLINGLSKNEKIKLILDSNVLIAYFDEVHSNHDETKEFLDVIDNKADVTFFTSVTIKSEFLDYQRKRFLTNGIIELVKGYNHKIKLNSITKTKINNIVNQRDNRLRQEEAREKEIEEFNSSINYFRDNDIKKIKRTFRARDVQEEIGWLKICSVYLGQKLIKQEAMLDEFCVYLSIHNASQKSLFIVDEVDWKKATDISSITGIGYSDSMILNIALSTNIENIATLDFDIIYSASILALNKKIIMPDRRIKDFKRILKL